MPGPRRADSRAVALQVLIDTDEGGFADSLLARALRETDLDDRDRDLATFLVYGTLAHRLILDHSIAAYCKHPIAKMDPLVLALLRMGLFQLGFCDRIPAYAAVDRTVALARGPYTRLRGLVNAVLRRAEREGLRSWESICRLRTQLEAGGEFEIEGGDWRRRRALDPSRSWEQLEAVERWALACSHPSWLVAMWIEELGASDTARLLLANNEAAPTTLRALLPREEALAALQERGHEVAAASLAPDAIAVRRAASEPGIAVPQGEASQLVVCVLDPQPGDNVLDACAAPGGKTAYIAQRVGHSGRVTAVDRGRSSGPRVVRTLGQASIAGDHLIDRVYVVEGDVAAEDPNELGAPFDRVLIDAPCSGLGTLRAHPEIRWRREPEDLDDLSQRQSRILDATATLVRVGGRVVYSTCTIARAENEQVVSDFLEKNPEFEREERLSGLDENTELHTFPFQDGLDGFYAAALVRRR